MATCSPDAGHNNPGPCGPAPCTGECRGVDNRRFITKACGCIGEVGAESYDIHDDPYWQKVLAGGLRGE